MAARMRGADVIVAIDLNEARLTLARRLGATHVVCARDEDVLSRVQEVVAEGVGYAVDCTGVPSVIETMMECLAIRGRAAQVGIPPPDKTVPVKILQHLLRGQEYVGCAGGDCVPSQMIPYLIRQQEEGRFPLEDMVEYYDVKDHERAFEDVKSGKVVKAVITWSSIPSLYMTQDIGCVGTQHEPGITHVQERVVEMTTNKTSWTGLGATIDTRGLGGSGS